MRFKVIKAVNKSSGDLCIEWSVGSFYTDSVRHLPGYRSKMTWIPPENKSENSVSGRKGSFGEKAYS